jgi:hypothetical protein
VSLCEELRFWVGIAATSSINGESALCGLLCVVSQSDQCLRLRLLESVMLCDQLPCNVVAKAIKTERVALLESLLPT